MNISLRMGRVLGFSYTQRLKYSSKLPAEFILPLNGTIVCWHREPEFPYEYSLPLPVSEKKAVESSSVLRIGEEIIKNVRKPTDRNVLANELAKITFTTKHKWYPRSRDRKAKKTPPDRPYL